MHKKKCHDPHSDTVRETPEFVEQVIDYGMTTMTTYRYGDDMRAGTALMMRSLRAAQNVRLQVRQWQQAAIKALVQHGVDPVQRGIPRDARRRVLASYP